MTPKKSLGSSIIADLFSGWPSELQFSDHIPNPEVSDYGLFHYTTSEGLRGIIETNCIWATAATYLNDASEIAYGYTVLDEVISEWEKANEGRESFAVGMLRIVRNMVNDNKRQLNSIPIYLACFC